MDDTSIFYLEGQSKDKKRRGHAYCTRADLSRIRREMLDKKIIPRHKTVKFGRIGEPTPDPMGVLIISERKP